MSFVINTNTLSLSAQQNLNQSQKSLNSAIERLSSGSKINSAKDDAAGQAISNRMTAQINGLEQASSNANDGISLAQTTEGALNQVNDNLQRVRELTVQAANGTNSESDLESIQNEIDQRLGEINRISEQTSFNGTNVLDGSKTAIDIQVGSKDGEQISINLAKTDSATLGLQGFSVSGPDIKTADVGGTQATAGRVGADVSVDIQADTNTTSQPATTGQNVYAKSDGSGYVVEADDGNYYDATVATDGSGNVDFDSSSTAVAAGDVATGSAVTTVKAQQTFDTSGLTTGNDIYAYSGTDTTSSVDGTDGSEYIISDGSGNYKKAVVASDGTVSEGAVLTGITAGDVGSTVSAGRVGADVTLGIQDDGDTTTAPAETSQGLYAKDGGGYVVKGSSGNYYDATVATDGSGDIDFDSSSAAVAASNVDVAGGDVSTIKTQETFDASGLGANQTVYAYNGSGADAPDYVIKDTSGTEDAYFAAEFASDGTVSQGEELSTGTGKTADPLASLDSALKQVDDLRSDLGAVQNRLDSAISNIDSTSINIESARSRITDADYATEVSNMSKAQILQQAGTSVLAQANQTSQGVLSLLG